MTPKRIDAPDLASAGAPRRRVLAGLGLMPLAVLLPACRSVGPPQAMPVAAPAGANEAPRVVGGERWRYVEINGYNGEPIARLDCVAEAQAGQLRVRRTDSRGAPRADELYAAAWRVIEEPFYDLVQRFEPPLPLLPEPLAPHADVWLRTSYRVTRDGAPLDWRERRRATGWERLRVPAGEFDALRIERTIHFVHADARRSQSVRTERLWYAPAARRWVRREWSGEYRGWPIRRGGPAREDWIVHLLEAHAPPG